MAIPRDNPYLQFNFLVSLGLGGSPDDPRAGFQECSVIGTEVTVVEWRHGNAKDNNVRKLTALNKAADVTLKRGIMGVLDLYQWLNDIREGTNTNERVKNITIQLRAEDHATTVMTWRLQGARIIKCNYGPFNAKGTDAAMEEVVIAYERLTVE